jgi:hypothetical protein
MFRTPAALIVLALLSAPTAKARPVLEADPAEMKNGAGLVCNGVVLSVEETGLRRDVSYPDISPPVFHFAQMKARVKVLHAFKGEPPAEVDLFYEVLDMKKYPQPMGDGPMRIWLEKGKRYRFFLKPDNGAYVGLLDGRIDDSFAVQTLWPKEPDDSPGLTASDAIKIARDYLASQIPGDTAPVARANCDGSTWIVWLQKSNDSRSGYCAIQVRGDGTVDPEYSKLWDVPQ